MAVVTVSGNVGRRVNRNKGYFYFDIAENYWSRNAVTGEKEQRTTWFHCFCADDNYKSPLAPGTAVKVTGDLRIELVNECGHTSVKIKIAVKSIRKQ